MTVKTSYDLRVERCVQASLFFICGHFALSSHAQIIIVCSLLSVHLSSLYSNEMQRARMPHQVMKNSSTKLFNNYFTCQPYGFWDGRPATCNNAFSIRNEHTMSISEKQENNKGFPYDRFFKQNIAKKKADFTYVVSKKINRLTNSFPSAKEFSCGERDIVDWCTTDCLGLSVHPKVREAVKYAAENHGAGTGGSRFLSGNSIMHENLEKELASLHQKEAALVFTSGFVANDTAIYTLAKLLPGCHIFSDAQNHASMIYPVRNSKAHKHIFRHDDPAHLNELLSKVDYLTPKLVLFETVHSLTGDICPLEQMCDIAHEHGALTYIDEVHAVGLYGHNGAGIGERDGVLDKMDIISGTLAKSFGNVGGYVASTANLIDVIRSYGIGFIYTISLPPTVIMGSMEAIRIARSDEGRALRKAHQANVDYMRQKLIETGVSVKNKPSHIIPVHLGNASLCAPISDSLIRDYGHYVQAIPYPVVARGQEMLRISVTSHHTRGMMDQFANDLASVWVELGLKLRNPG